MYVKKGKGPVFVTLANGSVMSRADLPAAATRRWVASRKALVVRAVEYGLISSKEACERYDLSVEELESWVTAMRDHGETALRATKIQSYRQP